MATKILLGVKGPEIKANRFLLWPDAKIMTVGIARVLSDGAGCDGMQSAFVGAAKMIGTERHHCRIIGLIAGFVLLMCTASAQTQPLGEKRTTTSGNVVTVYSVAWPTPVSSVSADVEVCASANAPPYTFAFPSYFQLRFADGGMIAPYGSKKKPTLERTPLQPSQCVRGWLDFAVTSGQKPVVIRYHEAGADNKPIEWAVK